MVEVTGSSPVLPTKPRPYGRGFLLQSCQGFPRVGNFKCPAVNRTADSTKYTPPAAITASFTATLLPYHDQRQSLKSMCNLPACAHHPLFGFGFEILSLLTAGVYSPEGEYDWPFNLGCSGC